MPLVVYAEAARRHHEDALALKAQSRLANAGQLFGFAMECGIKALLLASGVLPEPDGSILKAFRKHMPELSGRVNDVAYGQLIPNSRKAGTYLAMIPGSGNFQTWSVDQRYWGDASFPLPDLPQWERAAAEMSRMLDQARLNGDL